MDQSLINKKWLGLLVAMLTLPAVMVIFLAFHSTEAGEGEFSIGGFKELFTALRLGELLTIGIRAIFISIVSTAIAFLGSYVLMYTGRRFRIFFFIAITLPFLINESVRIFSWQYLLAENGLFNRALGFLARHPVALFSSTNAANVYVVMMLACIPFGIFICSAALTTVPAMYWKSANDLNLNPLSCFLKIAVPLCRFALAASLIIVFFIAFSLSSEVNFLGGDSKISTRNFVLSLMSAGKFQAIFALGVVIMGSLLLLFGLYKVLVKNKTL